MPPNGGKRAALLLELVDSSSDDEPSTPSRRDSQGRHVRRGGWELTARQNPDGVGMQKWRHEWWTSKLWKLLERGDATREEKGYWGVIFRRTTGTPRAIFDELVAEVKGYTEVPTHQTGEGVKAPPTIPVELKVAAALSHIRMGGLLQGAADRADIDVETLRRFIKQWTAAVVKHEYKKHVYAPHVGSEEFTLVQHIHAKLGFPGCAGMTDATHVNVFQVPFALLHEHKGKEGHPTRGLQCDRRRAGNHPSRASLAWGKRQ